MTATVSSTPSKPSKQAVATLRHIPPGWIGRIIAALATAAVLAYPLVSDDTYYQNMIIISLVFAVGASGLNIITGFTG
jgi:ABC-type branched-subunit amino acid transport system permease subunit